MSVFFKASGMRHLILTTSFCFLLVSPGQWRKKWFSVSISKPQIQLDYLCLKSLLKLMNLSLYWLRKTRRRATLETSLLWKLAVFKMFFLKVECEKELQISVSSLFHSINDDGGKRIKKEVIPYFELRNQ